MKIYNASATIGRIFLIALLGISMGCRPKKAAVTGRYVGPKTVSTHQPDADGGGRTDRSARRTIWSDASDAPALETRHRITNSAQLLEAYAAVLGVPTRELRDHRLYAFIDQWMGTPHRIGGASDGGIDCSAFTARLYQEVYGVQLPRTAMEMGNQVKRLYESQLREGDLVFFSFGGKKQIDHVGVYLANGKFVHVSSRRGVIISRLRDAWYYRYFTRCGSVPRKIRH